MVTILVMSMFMVSRGARWRDAALAYRPAHQADRIRRASDRIADAVGSYVTGALVQAFIAGVAAFIMLEILGVPAPLPLAVVIAVLDLIPLVGATLGAVIVGVVTLFVDFPTITIIWAVFAIAYQQFENYVVQPRIQSRAVALDPFVVVVAAIFGGTLFGVVGALLAIPSAAALMIAIREYLDYRRRSPGESRTVNVGWPAPAGAPGGGGRPPSRPKGSQRGSGCASGPRARGGTGSSDSRCGRSRSRGDAEPALEGTGQPHRGGDLAPVGEHLAVAAPHVLDADRRVVEPHGVPAHDPGGDQR